MKSKAQWIETSRRGKAQPLLVVDAVIDLYKQKYFQKAHRSKWGPKNYRQFDSASWFGVKDYQEYQDLLTLAADSKDQKLLKYGREYEKRIIAHRTFADKYSNYDFYGLSNKELRKIFSQWFELTKRFWSFAYDYIFINKFLPDIVTSVVASKVLDVKKQNKYLGILFEADEPSELRQEKKNLLEIVKYIRNKKTDLNNDIVHRKLSKHLNEYAHLGFYYFRGSSYNLSDLKKRVSEYLKINRIDFNKIESDFNKQNKNNALVKGVIRELKLDKKTVDYIRYIKRWGSLSNKVDETYGYVVHKCWGLWHEIAKRFGISYQEFYHLTGTEIIKNLDRAQLPQKLKNKIKLRHKDHALVLENNKKSIYVGNELRSYSLREKQDKSFNKNVKELKGQPVSPGQKKGRVIIVHTVHDVRKVERGDIIVANSTNPTYVPAMERAGAIVTDEGGLLSHAAIVSRELKVPCVVGTKIATRVLKDGDIINVDAEKGIIKIVS